MIGLKERVPALGYDSSLNSAKDLTHEKSNLLGRIDTGSLSSVLGEKFEYKDSESESVLISIQQPTEKVTLKTVEAAINRIYSSFSTQDKDSFVSLVELEKSPMNVMALAASLLSVKILGDSAELKALALEIRAKGADELRLRQNEDLRKQIDKAIEDQDKAKKAGVFAVVVDWAVSAAEIVSGVAKIVIGNYAGGAMDLAAGSAGLVKAMCETLAMIDTENANKYKEIAEVAGKIQLAFEIAGMMVDVVSVGRGMMAAKSLGRATETAMQKGAGELLENTIKQGSNAAGKDVATEVIKDVSKQVASEVTEQMAPQIAKNLTEQTTKFLGQGHLLQAFSSQAIENMISKSIERVAMNALQSGAETTAEEITKQVVKEVQREIVRAAVGASIKSAPNMVKSVTRAGMEGANDVFKAEIDKERAELQKVIQQLMTDTSFYQFLLDDFERIKKRTQEDISTLLDSAGQTLSSASEYQLKTSAMLSSIAANIA